MLPAWGCCAAGPRQLAACLAPRPGKILWGTAGGPRLHTALRAEARATTPDRPVRIPSGSSRIVHRTVERRKRLQQLYHELQALDDDSSRSNAR